MTIVDAVLVYSTIDAITPILLAALAGMLCQRAGVFNIALEGLMLAGAFGAVAGSWYANNAELGVASAVAFSASLAIVLAVATLFGGNVIVLGIAVNVLASGMTVFLLRLLFGRQGVFSDPALPGLAPISVPGFDRIGNLGAVIGGHTWIVYLSWLLVPTSAVLLFQTPVGLRLRGVGEQPDAAATLGVNVRRYRCLAILASGVLCGLAGAQLSLGSVTLFSENMSAGRGWIAVVAVMLGRARPAGVLLSCIAFGIADAIGLRLQGQGLPNQLTDAAPYVITLIALFLTFRKAPA
ncbi:ABC transporter permease [Mesorhizobium koreense]|uniref:ABC transporter permease n=1 Tax=Mesorhizobium koreense TaxID=3074855 RepID=UPI00287BA1DF|nr:ABC transporter permease [Mesorhizobium sp. WR6]